MIFVLKFGAWRMSGFATDRRYSDNNDISFVIACGLSVIMKKVSHPYYY